MRKLTLLSLFLLLTISLIAQTAKPSPSTPKLVVWQVTPTASVQYDPTVWKLATIESPDHDNPQALFLMGADKVIRPDVALNVTVIPTTDKMGAADIIASRVAATEDEKGVTRIALREYQAGDEYGVLFAYTAQNDKGVDFVIGRWSFAGDKLDTKSHSVIEFEGVVPIATANDDIMGKIETVIKTYQIK
jgi:hypothetical protein